MGGAMTETGHTLAYLATPYTKYSEGIEQAFIEACKLAGRLIQAGIHVYSPIAHSHPIAIHANIDPLDQTFWLDLDGAMLHVCRALIVAHMDGWEQSTGIAHEIEFFEQRRRAIFDLDPKTLRMVKRETSSKFEHMGT